jgi:hypothetical protein
LFKRVLKAYKNKNKKYKMIYKDLKIEELQKYCAVLSEKEKNLIHLQSFDFGSSFFNCIKNIDNSWVISAEEIANCVDKQYFWLKNLELILFVPMTYPDIPFYL